MPRRTPAARPEPVIEAPVIYTVGEHALSLCVVSGGRWSVALDGGAPAAQTFMGRVEAWEAGVRAAHAQDLLSRP